MRATWEGALGLSSELLQGSGAGEEEGERGGGKITEKLGCVSLCEDKGWMPEEGTGICSCWCSERERAHVGLGR